MAITRRDEARDMRELARRIHHRWLEYRRRHPGMSVPINDTLSRILEHDPAYRPQRRRAARKERQPLRNPGVFTLKEIANALETTVGDLLGEPGYVSMRDVVSRRERRTLRDAVLLLRDLFDLEDESLTTLPAPSEADSVAGIHATDFVAGDYTFPEPLRVWIASPDAASAEALPVHIRELTASRYLVARLLTDAFAPEVRSGWKITIDTERLSAAEGSLVAAYLRDDRSVLGRWRFVDGRPWLDLTHGSFRVDDATWILLGVVASVISPDEAE
ncbi:MAG TPA: hypothetical protein VHL59_18225 [Thermoanaerobaculia bacterium]|nr:hypothetical protein [Thermoanaerobaculia bacterium]